MADVLEIVPEVEGVKRPNRQLWENSPMKGSSVDDFERELEGRLFNSRSPNLAIIAEKPEHRLIILLKSQGHSNKEIAQLTGYTAPWVGQILRQPWAKRQLIEEISKGGREAVQTLLEGSAVDSIYTIIELRDTAEDDGVRLRASQDLLDRHLGKATQHIEARSTVQHVSAEIGQVDEQLKKLELEEQRLLGTVAQRAPAASQVDANT